MGGRRHSDINRHLYGKGRKNSLRKKHNQQKHQRSNHSFNNQNKTPRENTKRVELHFASLKTAKDRIIEECRDADVFETVIFIHGFNSGTAIRDYIRNGPLMQSLESRKIKFEIWHDQQGTTFFNKLK
jgi:hypothetical protein